MTVSRFEELVRMGIALAGERNMAVVLKLIVEHARRFTGAEHVVFFVKDGGHMMPVAFENDQHTLVDPHGLDREADRLGVDVGLAVVNSASKLVVPVNDRAGNVVGILVLVNAQETAPERVFSPDDSRLMALLAGHAAIALENARTSGETQERLRTTETLLSVARALSRAAPLEEMMRRVGREVARAIGADAVGAYLLDSQKETLVPVAGYRLPKALLLLFRGMRLRLERWSGLRDAMRDRRSMWSSDANNDPRCDRDAIASVPPHSMLFAPTMARGEAVGGIYALWWQTGRRFPREEIQLIEGVAAQVGLALENVELARQTEAKLKETNTLLAVSRAMSSSLDVDVLVRQFLGRIATVLDADGVGSYMLRDSEWLTPLQGYRLPPERLELLRKLRLSIVSHPFYAEGARTKRPVFSPDAMNDSRIPDVMREAVPHKSELFIPIVAKGQVIGGLIAAWWNRVREFSEGELALIEAIASQAGIALENARLFQENRRRLEELSVLHGLSRAITGQLDRKALIEALDSEVTRVFDARNVVVALSGDTEGEAELVLRITDGVRDADVPQILTQPEAGLAGVVMTTGVSLRTDDHAEECARRGIAVRGDAPVPPYWLGVPMTVASHIQGVIALASKERPFTDSDERLLTNVAQLAALALRSARLFEERETAYGQLSAAQDELVRTEKLRALGEMASGVAHDFNNVLAAILGRAQLLMGNLRDPQLRQWAEIIDQAAQDGAQTVRRLQEFTRVRRDQPEVPVDLNEIVQGALDMTQSRWGDDAGPRNVTVDVRTALTAVPRIPGDPSELREALTNLILNAVDAMPQGGVLTLATRVVLKEIELTISDTGTGIPASVREKIFDPFFTTKGPRGTGLGLSMTYGIIARHQGHVDVESEPGRGTTFRLTFPIRDVSALPDMADVVAAPRSAASVHCLVVDDEEHIASVLSDVLTSGGHTAAVFTDPESAIERARTERFDVLFTDLAMPGMPGWQVARAVKDLQPDIAVILMTGYGIELSDEDREQQGVDAVLTKPVGVNSILDAVARVTTRHD